MHYFKIAAIGVIALGMASHADSGKLTTGVAAQASNLENQDYHTGMGLNGFVGMERAMMDAKTAGELGVRANYGNYQIEGDEFGKDLNEGGIALTGMIGPNFSGLQPKVGGHVGYARVDEENYLDIGADLKATYSINENLGVHALVTPTWFIGEDQSDFYGTKYGLGVSFSAPGG